MPQNHRPPAPPLGGTSEIEIPVLEIIQVPNFNFGVQPGPEGRATLIITNLMGRQYRFPLGMEARLKMSRQLAGPSVIQD